MKQTLATMIFILIAATLLILICSGCSKPTKQETLEYHPEGWVSPTSSNFHGAQSQDLDQCTSCHGADYQGGASRVSCYTCHNSYPHSTGWASAMDHGQSVVNSNFNITACAACHQTVANNDTTWSCWTCHDSYPHSTGWASATAHGQSVVNSNFNIAACAACHQTVANNDTTWSCWTCHSYYPHKSSINPNNPNGAQHGGAVAEADYQVWLCKECHGPDYSGGLAGVTCNTCHSHTPETCNTCHGNFYGSWTDPVSWAPPNDLLGRNDSTLTSVGVHRWHVKPQAIPGQQWIGGPYGCNLCHTVPTGVGPGIHPDVPSHPATIHFGPLAQEEGANPVWNHNAATCAATYCHNPPEFGNPANPVPIWNLPDSSQVACGTCHQMPPPNVSQHQGVTTCGCHFTVWGSGNVIINPALHVNGDVNVY